jgi:hypothetical protein
MLMLVLVILILILIVILIGPRALAERRLVLGSTSVSGVGESVSLFANFNQLNGC